MPTIDLLNNDPRKKALSGDARPRHPEKAHRPDNPIQKKPDWIRVKAPGSPQWKQTHGIVKENGLVTVCEEAGCPNIGECWEKKHATFMIMGDTCTRACAFCNVKTGIPAPLDPAEPEYVATATAKLGLRHVVVTSVDRDDLGDGGAEHFARTIRAIRAKSPGTTIEILTPDFLRKPGALEVVVAARPDVFNHNLETVPGKYLTVRPGARYFHSIRLLQRVKELDPSLFTKSGIMVGLGEERNEVLQLMDDLRSAEVDFITIGQYLQPTKKHHAVSRFVTPEEFRSYETLAYTKGFLMVSSSPLTRSSHHAGEDFARLQAARQQKKRLMPKFETIRKVQHAPQVMFDLVADVERYPEFVPMCSALRIRRRSEAQGVVALIADMSIGYKMIRETFTTRVALDQGGATIAVSYIDGPFKHMENNWKFLPDPAGCAIHFFIDYEFRSRTFQMLAGAVFEQVFRKMAEAFEARADQLARQRG